MSVMLRTPAINVLDNIFIFYDFQQIADAMMVVSYIEKTNKWEKIFIYKIDDEWQVESLKAYFDNTKFNWICEKLNIIFHHSEDSNQFGGVNIDSAILNDANFFLGINKID